MKKNLIVTTTALMAVYGVGCYLWGACVSGFVHAHKIRRQNRLIKGLTETIDYLIEKDLEDGFETDEEGES